MKKILVSAAFTFVVLVVAAFTHSPITWIAIGDSITYLNDHLDETKDRVSKGYLTDVVERLPYVHYVNCGHNGWTSRNFARSFDTLGIPVGDVYTVFLGTNDWWQGYSAGSWKDFERATGDSTIYGCFRIILDKLHRLNKDAPIILITPMQRTDFVYINDPMNNAFGCYKEKRGQSLEQVVEAIRNIGQHEQLRVIDLYHVKQLGIPRLVRYKRLKDLQTGEYRNYSYPGYISIPFNPGTDEYPYPIGAVNMTFDGLHPSDRGNRVIAGKVEQALRGVH